MNRIAIIKRMLIYAVSMIFWTSLAFSGELRTVPRNLKLPTDEYFDSVRFQSAIRSDRSLGDMAKENSPLKENTASYGFSEKSEEANFFIIGTLYSEAVAFLNSGNSTQAAKRLAAIEKQCISLNVPSSLYNFISKIRNIIETERFTPDAQAEILSLFQPFFEDYAKANGADKLVLFRAGSWFMDMSLTAAAGNTQLLKQPDKLDYFIKEMKRLDAPKGVLDALDEIGKIAKSKDITDSDADKVLKLVKKIQEILV